jgi:hypothetical protein
LYARIPNSVIRTCAQSSLRSFSRRSTRVSNHTQLSS